MSDDKTQDLQDLLNKPLDEVQTDTPLFNTTTELRLADAKIEPNKKGTGSNLNLQFAFTVPTADRNGKVFAPGTFGTTIFHTISLAPTEKYNPAENLAKLKLALTGSKSGAFGPPEQYIGSVVMAVLKPDSNPEYGDKTVIGRFIKKG